MTANENKATTRDQRPPGRLRAEAREGIRTTLHLLAAACLVGACGEDASGPGDITGSGGSAADACGELNIIPGPTMRPGQNCLGCHQDGFGDPNAPEFSAAGTVFAAADSQYCEGLEGVRVYLTAIDGTEIELITNGAGNFWTQEPLASEGPGPRLQYQGRTIRMARNLPTIPACNACHSNPPLAGAPGKIYAP